MFSSDPTSRRTAVDSATMEIAVDVVSIDTIDAGIGAHLEHPATPRPKSPSATVSYKEHMCDKFPFS
jgi:hypothetical protein